MTRNTLSHFPFRGQRLAYAAILLAGLALSLSPVQVVHAATITVTTTADEFVGDGDCALREAIISANTNTSFDTCTAGVTGMDTIHLPAGFTITLTLVGTGPTAGDLDINEDLAIVGLDSGATVVANGAAFGDRVFDISAGVTATLTNLTMTGAVIAGENGGGIRVAAGATLTRALLNGSPAIDAGNDTDPPNPGTAACEVADQSSVARPQGAACDMGAYEARPTIFLPMIFDTFTPTP